MSNDAFKEFGSDKKVKKLNISMGQALTAAIMIFFSFQLLGSVVQLPAIAIPVLNNFTIPLSYFVGSAMAFLALKGWFGFDSRIIINHLKVRTNLLNFLLSILLFLCLLPISELITSLIPTHSDQFPIVDEVYKVFSKGISGFLDYKYAGVFTICVLAPVMEEILFRGVLLRGMLQKGIKPVYAIVWSAILFGLVHGNPWQFVGAGILGAVFGFIYWRTKSLRLCILLHALNNSASSFLYLKYEDTEEMVFPQNPVFWISGIFIGIVLMYTLIQTTKNIKWN